jgi:3-hydroxybenzoate 6-monooxygenase
VSHNNSRPVAVAGGGIGGLACALALARHGFQSVVLEQAPAFGEIGAGLQVAPNALAVLEALGVTDAKMNCLAIDGVEMFDAVTGEKFIDIPCGAEFEERFGNPYAVAHRSDIHGALLRACQSSGLVELRTDSHVAGFEVSNGGVSVKLSSGAIENVAALIGADGINSQIRRAIVGDDEPLCPGAVVYRALIPAADMPREEQKRHPTIWAGPRAHMIYYPIRDQSAFNFAITIMNAELAKRGQGKASREEAIGALKLHHEIPRHLISIPGEFGRYLLRYREPAANWTLGPVTLLGDAAHPMVQYLAQGAAMALEDAICLGECLVESKGNFAEAFESYQTIRIVRSARVQISALMMDKLLHADGVERLVRNSMFMGRTPGEYYDRLSWLYTSPWYVR